MCLAIRMLFTSLFCIFCMVSLSSGAPIENPIPIDAKLDQLQLHSVRPLHVAITSLDETSPPPQSSFRETRGLNLGFYPNRAVWLQFEVKTSLEADRNKNYILELPSRPGLTQLFEDGNPRPIAESGVLVPIERRPIQESAVAFPLKLRPGEVQRFTVRMVNRYAHLGFLNLYSEHGFIQSQEKRHLMFGYYAGLMAALLLISLGLFIFPHQKWESLLYILAQGSIHLAIPANILGFTAQLWPKALFADYNSRPLMIVVGSVSLGFFCSRFLRVKERAPIINRALMASIAIVASCWLWTYFDPTTLSSLTAPLTIWLQIFCFALGCYFLYKGDRPAIFYVVGFGSLLMASFFTLTYTTYRFVHLGSKIPEPITVIQVSAVVNALALAYALMERIKEEREGRLQAEIDSRRYAESASRLKSDLLRNISHELRTPLNSIVGFSEVLAETLEGGEAHQYASIINQNSHRLTNIINEILDYTNLERGELPLNRVQFHLNALIDEIISYYQPTYSKKQLMVRCHISDQIPNKIVGDRFRLKQVLMHVIGNSVQFTEAGSLEISADLNPENRKQVRIRIQDTGAGISPEVQEKLFEPFNQGDTSSTRTHYGIGMGLTFSKSLARHMGGDVKLVQSSPQAGTTIEVLVPISMPEPRIQDNTSEESSKSHPTRHRFFHFRLN